jgi:hypothetical protein
LHPAALLTLTQTVPNVSAATTYANWFFSPGFGGVAAIFAAALAYAAARYQGNATLRAADRAANSAKERDAIQRKREDDAVRRDLRGYLVNAAFSGANAFAATNATLLTVARAAQAFQALRGRANERDVPLALSDREMSALRAVVTFGQQFVEDAFTGEPQIAREDLLPDLRTKAGMAAAMACVALHRMDPSDSWKQEVHLPDVLTSSLWWGIYQDNL